MTWRNLAFTWTVVLLSPVFSYAAGDGAAQPAAPAEEELFENNCHDAEIWARIDGLLKQHPRDPLAIRSYALRLGVCRLMEEKKISLESGIQVFDTERQRAIMERSMEEFERQRKKSKPDEDVEPLS